MATQRVDLESHLRTSQAGLEDKLKELNKTQELLEKVIVLLIITMVVIAHLVNIQEYQGYATVMMAALIIDKTLVILTFLFWKVKQLRPVNLLFSLQSKLCFILLPLITKFV